jgi:hypothetical protein
VKVHCDEGVMGEANQYCQSQAREFLLTNETETQPPYVLGNYPRAEISFQCVPPQLLDAKGIC